MKGALSTRLNKAPTLSHKKVRNRGKSWKKRRVMERRKGNVDMQAFVWGGGSTDEFC
jgi:hypothetical protein